MSTQIERSRAVQDGFATGLAEARAELDRTSALRLDCLRLAATVNDTPEETVTRATAYAEFVVPADRDRITMLAAAAIAAAPPTVVEEVAATDEQVP